MRSDELHRVYVYGHDEEHRPQQHPKASDYGVRGKSMLHACIRESVDLAEVDRENGRRSICGCASSVHSQTQVEVSAYFVKQVQSEEISSRKLKQNNSN